MAAGINLRKADFEKFCWVVRSLTVNSFAFAWNSDQLCNFEHIQYAIRAGHVPVRGVNLGGWLVAENWINSKDPLWYGVPSEVW